MLGTKLGDWQEKHVLLSLFLIKIDIIILLVNNLSYLICMDVLPIHAWCPGVQEKVLESLELEFQMAVTSRAAGRNPTQAL